MKKLPTPFPVVLAEVCLIAAVIVAAVVGSAWRFLSHLEIDQAFNFVEGLVWTAIGLIFVFRALRKAPHRRLKAGAAATFLLFGLSDFIEVGTGAWFTPWPLLVLKTTCVISLIVHLWLYKKARHSKGF